MDALVTLHSRWCCALSFEFYSHPFARIESTGIPDEFLKRRKKERTCTRRRFRGTWGKLWRSPRGKICKAKGKADRVAKQTGRERREEEEEEEEEEEKIPEDNCSVWRRCQNVNAVGVRLRETNRVAPKTVSQSIRFGIVPTSFRNPNSRRQRNARSTSVDPIPTLDKSWRGRTFRSILSPRRSNTSK